MAPLGWQKQDVSVAVETDNKLYILYQALF